MEPFKEAFEAWLHRVRAPILGYTLLAGLVINWKPLWALLFADIDVFSKFLYFDLRTDYWTLILLPLFVGVLSAIVSPWFAFAGAYMVRLPARLQVELQEEARHQAVIRKIKRQAEEEAARENALIERAKRDAVAGDVDPEAAQALLIERAKRDAAAADVHPEAAQALKRARESIKLDKLKRTQAAEELGQEAVEALWQARAADQEQDADGALLHSNIDEFAIKFLGGQPNAVNQTKLMSAPRGFEEFMEVVPGATPQRFRTELIDAFARLKKRGLVSDVGVLDWSLTSTGYEEYDRLTKSS